MSKKYPGVSFCNTRKKWIAYGQQNKKCVYIGQFETEDDAGEARIAFQNNPPDTSIKAKIDINNMDTCRSFKRSINDY